ncbi:MAG: hypothetical protein R6U20_12055, partial [Longimonas sp.]
MIRWHGLDIEAEGTGISKPLSRQVNLLGHMLGEATRTHVVLAAFRGAPAGPPRFGQVAAAARVHRRDQQHPAGIADMGVGARDHRRP